MSEKYTVINVGKSVPQAQYNTGVVGWTIRYLQVSPSLLPGRILGSLVPPPLAGKSHPDLVGPFLAVIVLAALLHYGHTSKMPSTTVSVPPSYALLLYAFLMPVFVYTLGRAGGAGISFFEVVSLVGYSMFGHIFTLAVSLVFFQETSNAFFFCCLIIFGGLSTLRLALILLASIPLPAARLVVCSIVGTTQLLSLIFLHFAYMHHTFSYSDKP